VPIAFKVTVYEDYLLKLLAAKCGVSKSTLVRVALLRMLVGIVEENSFVRRELPPGYDSMLKELSRDVEGILEKCVEKLAK
jgi:DNA-binding MurR/RpiR family transcriptional regulator